MFVFWLACFRKKTLTRHASAQIQEKISYYCNYISTVFFQLSGHFFNLVYFFNLARTNLVLLEGRNRPLIPKEIEFIKKG